VSTALELVFVEPVTAQERGHDTMKARITSIPIRVLTVMVLANAKSVREPVA